MAKEVTLTDLSRQINTVNDGVIELAQTVHEGFAHIEDELKDMRSDIREINVRLTRIEKQILKDHEKRITLLEATIAELQRKAS